MLLNLELFSPPSWFEWLVLRLPVLELELLILPKLELLVLGHELLF